MKTQDWYKPQSLEFNDLPLILRETYTRGIERYLTNEHYKKYPNVTYTVGSYTALFEDLEDTVVTFATKGLFCDKVSGITMHPAAGAMMTTLPIAKFMEGFTIGLWL